MIKNILLIILSMCITCCRQGPNILQKPKVDERVELLSLVFRLAESQEYSSEAFKLYTDRINKHYEPFKSHRLISFIKKIRNENGIGYDAVMNMAIHLDDDLNPIIPFSDYIPDKRWGKQNANTFVSLLKQFYVDSDSDTFFKNNKMLFKEVSANFKPVYNFVNINWYEEFFGQPPNDDFIIITALGNGHGNFGPSIEVETNEKKVYAIIGVWNTDSVGMAKFKIKQEYPILLHEFNHSFINHLLEENHTLFRESGEIIFEAVKNDINSSYNNWKVMFNEALVRAAVIKYMKDHNFPNQEIEQEVNKQLNNGFFWMKDLVTELDNYSKKRAEFSTLENYFPELAKTYSKIANDVKKGITTSKLN